MSSIVLTVSLFFLFNATQFILLTRATTWDKFIQDNPQWFTFLSVTLGLITNLLIAAAFTYLVYILDKKHKIFKQEGASSFTATFLSTVSVGCTVCGGLLLPLVGIAASLSAFPFLGLEIKVLALILILFSLSDLSKKVAGVFAKPSASPFITNKLVIFSVIALFLVYALPRLPYGIKQQLAVRSLASANPTQQKPANTDADIFNQVNPEEGYELSVSYGQLGPKMIELGVLDPEKFEKVYKQNGSPLTEKQREILTQGSHEKIKITRENSYFLLNFFWAAGLANKSKILLEGDMMKYGGRNGAGGFASTGGWTLGKGDPMDYYAAASLIPLTAEQEALVDSVAANIYRPCCNNSTAFPDCNHGMALLAVLQLLAANGATEAQMYEAGKYFSAFWFPGNYFDLALYFKNKEGKSFKEVDGKALLGKDFSSASGWQSVKQWLIRNGIVEQPPKQGGGCGV